MEELAQVLERAGLSPEEALSRRSKAYKELGLAERHVSSEELLKLMVQEPTLLRRPLVISEEGALLGFNRDLLAQLVARTEG